MRDLGYESLIAVPLRAPVQGILGALVIVRAESSGERFDADSLLFAQDLARRCAGALVRSQAFEESQRIGERFQRAALPRALPRVDDVFFDAYYEPAESSLLIGGDWYDAFLLPDGTIGMTMGDDRPRARCGRVHGHRSQHAAHDAMFRASAR